jgi:hypothetical protein
VLAVAGITVSEKVLLAAHALEEAGQSPFSAEALVVSAWKKFPDTFGLKDFTGLYPDSNKVLSCIMGERGLPRRGWLAKLGHKQYALTREGRQAIRRLMHADEALEDDSPTPVITLPRDEEKQLQTLLATSALTKFLEDRKAELTFADACRYWGITENLSGSDLDARLQDFRARLVALDRQLGANGRVVLAGGRSIGGEDIGELDRLHAYLEQRFARHLNLLRHRAAR